MIFELDRKTDTLGVLSSTLCLIHCISSPFIFTAIIVSHHCCSQSPSWWKWFDLLFLIISLLAVKYSIKKSTKTWIKIGLISSWIGLLFIVANSFLNWIHLPFYLTYTPPILLIILHLRNKKCNQCECNQCEDTPLDKT